MKGINKKDIQFPKKFLLISSTNTFLTLKALENPSLPPSSPTQRLIQPIGSPPLPVSLFRYSLLLPLFSVNRWMLEKYDGVRAFWNPQSRCFYSRTGLKKNLPQDIIDSMPNIFLDGELWYNHPPLSLCLPSCSLNTHFLQGLEGTTLRNQ